MADQAFTITDDTAGQALIAALNSSRDGSSTWVSGYNAINAYIQANPNAAAALGSATTFWYQNAPQINGNDPTSQSNTFIRTVTATGLAYTNSPSSPSVIQTASNNIANAVFQSVLTTGQIQPVQSLINDDITQAYDSGQTLGGWGGAAYYWNYLAPRYLAQQPGQTIGQYIMANPVEQDKFIASNANANVAALGVPATPAIAGEVSPGVDAALANLVYNAGVGTSLTSKEAVPSDIQLAIAGRTAAIVLGASPVGDPNLINGYFYSGKDANGNGIWIPSATSLGDIPNTPEPADATIATQLDLIQAARQAADTSHLLGGDTSLHTDIQVSPDGITQTTQLNSGNLLVTQEQDQGGAPTLLASVTGFQVMDPGNIQSDTTIVNPTTGGLAGSANDAIQFDLPSNVNLNISDLGGSATIQGGDNISLTVNGSAAILNLGDNAVVNDYDTGGSVTTGGNSSVGIWNDGVQTINLGSLCTDGIHCIGDSVSGSGETVSVDGADSQVTVDGTGNNISAVAGSTLDLDGSNNTATATGATINLGTDATVNVVGDSDMVSGGDGANVNLIGTADTATLGDNAVGIAYGADDSLTGGSGSSFNLTQNDDTATVGANSYVGVPSGTGDTINENNGQLNTLDNVGLTLAGSGDDISAGNDVNVTASGSGNSVSVGANSTGLVVGSADTLTVEGNNSSFNLQNTGDGTDSVDLNGAGDYAGLLGGAGYMVGGTGSGNLVGTLDNTQFTMAASGDRIVTDIAPDGSNTAASSDTITGNGDVLAAGSSGDAVSIDGGTAQALDVLSVSGDASIQVGSDGWAIVSGTSDVVDETGEGAVVGLENTGSGTDTANLETTSDIAGLLGGSGYMVNGSGGVVLASNDTDFMVNGSNDSVHTSTDDGVTLNGGGNDINQDSGSLTLEGTGGNDDYGTVTGTTVTLGNNANVSLAANSDTLDAGTADGVTLNGGGNDINQDSGSLTLEGTGGNDDYGTVIGTTVTLGNNANVNLAANSDTLDAGTADGVTLNGGGNNLNQDSGSLTLEGTGGNDDFGTVEGTTVTLGNNANVNLAANSDTLDAGTDDGVTLRGGSNDLNQYSGSLTLDGTGGNDDYGTVDGTALTLGNNSNVNLTANYDTLDAGTADGVTLDGGGNNLNQYSGSLTLEGTGGADDYGTVDGTALTLGNNSNVNLTANYDTLDAGTADGVTLDGGGNNLNQYSGSLTLEGTGGADDYGTVDGTALTLGNNSNVNLTANYDTLDAGTADGVTLDGGGNNLNQYSGSLTLEGTGGADDYGTVDGTTVTLGNNANVNLAANSDTLNAGTADGVTLDGGGDIITLTGNDNLGAYGGGGDTINSDGGGDTVAVANTGGNGDTINGAGVSVYLNPNAQANTGGSGDTITLTGNDNLGAYGGGGDTINSDGGGDSVAVANTGGNGDTINGAGVDIYINPNAQANVNGFGDSLTATSGDTTNITGNNDTFTAYGNDSTTVAGNNDVLTATGGTESITGAGDVGDINNGTVSIGASTTTNIIGSGDAISFGQHDTTGVSGNYDTINAGLYDTTSIVGNDESYNAAFATGQYGADDTLGITGSNELIDANFNSISLGSNTSISGNGDEYDKIIAVSGDTAALSASYDDSAFGNNLSDFEISGGSGNSLTGDGDSGDATSGFSVEDTSYTGSDDPGNGTYEDDPVVLNLSGQSVQTQSVSNSTAFFDMQNNGQQVQTGWLTAGEGVLVYDPSGAPVTQDSQLVGGFDALSKLAQTSDTTLDASNPLFDQLKVWVDPTGDAQFKPQDLYTLQDLGITSISMTPQSESVASNGNTILDDATFTWKGGLTGDIAGVDLFYNPQSVADSLGQPAQSMNPDALANAMQELGNASAGASFASSDVLTGTPLAAGIDLSGHPSDITAKTAFANTPSLASHPA